MLNLNLKPVGTYKYDAVSLGEVMLRLDPGEGRIRTARQFRAWEGGGEYNVVRGLHKCFGMQTGEMRYGVDFSAAPGTRILAPESGTVIFLGERPGYGYVIEIRHEDGFVSRLSCGADPNIFDLVLERHVTKGETIAQLPQVEGVTESILHYELLIDGIPYNPLFYLPEP